jgi:hypothetical protein
MGLMRLAALGAVGYGIWKYATQEKTESYAGVRDAGPEQMQTPPKTWSARDETLDESFPASDPPSTY